MKAKTFLKYCEYIHELHSRDKISLNDALFEIYEAIRFYSQPFTPSMLAGENRLFDFPVPFEIEENVIHCEAGTLDLEGISVNDFIYESRKAGIDLQFKEGVLK